jgi:signal transduction histidine kinase
MVIKLRRLSNDLRPLILEDLGIAAAVSFLNDELAHQMPGCEVHYEVIGEERRLESDVEVTVFRIVQQALNNVRRHAPGATWVDVRLTFTPDDIRVTISDNGPGFMPQESHDLMRQGHLGLAGMRERADLLGGEVDITSNPATGTTITLTLPCEAH